MGVGSNNSTGTAEQDSPLISEKGRISEDISACQNYNDFEKLVQLASERDTDAFNSFLLEKLMLGDCSHLAAGTVVTVEDYHTLTGALCVRPQGEIDCKWTVKKMVVRITGN